jgi:hypothetical protein
MYVSYLTIYHGEKLPPYYIGSTSILKIEKGYHGSVSSKRYKQIFKSELLKEPNLFETIILSTHENRKEAIEMELLLQVKFDVVKSKNFFNESFAKVNGMFGRDVSGINHPMFGKKQTEHAKKIMREKRGTKKTYTPSDEHKRLTSVRHKNKIVSEETKKKISRANKGKFLGINNPMFGKKHSNETKEKLSKKNKGKILSRETKEKISIKNKGRNVSNETRKKISDIKLGKKRKEFSIEWKENLSKSRIGKTRTDETKKKMSNTRIGMKYKENICPFCNKKGRGGNMKRYHFDNCHFKNI